jgi:fumarate reductase iron-sulfur subunit
MDRHQVLGLNTGIWDCTFIGECSVVCPKDVDPAGAIQRAKVPAAAEGMLSMVLPFGGRE